MRGANELLKKNIICLLVICIALPLFLKPAPVNAMVPYKTYFYTSWGMYFLSPDAYIPVDTIGDEVGGEISSKLATPSDMVTDEEGDVYVADTGNNRVVIYDSTYTLKQEIIGFKNSKNEAETFNKPAGVFVTNEALYIADTSNSRIVVLNKEDMSFNRSIGAPASDILPDGFIYAPSAVAVDNTGRLYVVSKSTNMGVIALSPDGKFEGFIGAEKVTPKITELFWKLFTTKEQKQRSNKNVPTEYNNVTIDEKGFAYVTTSALDGAKQLQAMKENDASSLYAPLKKLNPAGVDVLRRNGTFGVAGDIQRKNSDVSRFIDVALSADGVYSALDSSQNKIFTYDINGNLLYAFGGYGTQSGVFQSAAAITYKGTDLLVLDSKTGLITTFSRTHYGDSLALALNLQNERKYTEASEQWKYILTLNSSFDQAYSGAAASYMRMGDYKLAMENYKIANNYDGYYKAYAEYRKISIKEYFILVPIGAVGIIVLLVFLSKQLQKCNEKNSHKKGKKNVLEQAAYAYHIIFHPFDGFYDLKHEKRGGVGGAVLILALVFFNSIFRQFVGAYYYKGETSISFDPMSVVMQIGIPFVLWILANWGLTTLMDGEGSMKDIFVTTSYALTPLFLLGIPETIASNFVTPNEFQFISFLSAVGLIWSLLLIFFGALTTNAYSLGKNTVTVVLSIVGMGFMAFLGVVSISIVQKLIDFGSTIVSEITFRI